MPPPSFEIHTKEGEAVYIHELDEQAATLWGKAVHPKEYAYPKHEPEKYDSYKERFDFLRGKEDWYNKLGWMIATSESPTWGALRAEILAPFKEYNLDTIMNMPEIGGFIKLIDLWESKEYTPVSIKD